MIDPIGLFYELDKSGTEFDKLRDAQEELLDDYVSEGMNYPRIGLKLPTGSGKSLIAILLLESYRRTGKRSAILCANKGLVDDMKKKFDELKLPAVTIRGGTGLGPRALMERTKKILSYSKCESVGIFNYHSFMYGYGSTFSFPLPKILIIDDASDFEIVRNEFGSILIKRRKPIHENCYDEILSKLSENHSLYPNITDFQSNESSRRAVELILFSHHQSILGIIDRYKTQLNEDSGFFHSYRRNKDYIDSSIILVSQNDIEIRPFVIPEERTPIKDVSKVIFMSATLPNKKLVHKIFGIDENEIYMLDETKLKEETFKSIQTMGCRAIFPLSQEHASKALSIEGLDAIVSLFSIHKKVLIFVNSFKESRQITNYLAARSIPFVIYSQSDDGTNFANNQKEGCLICVNRFFGLDFPGDTCKVGVIAKLPLIWDSMDRFQISILGNDDYKEERLGNRITQALGRCNRLENDESIYYIFDSAILNKIVDPSYHCYYPKNIFSEMMMGFNLTDGDISNAIEYGRDRFFGVDKTEYLKELKEYEMFYSPISWVEKNDGYLKEIFAWKLASRGGYKEAAKLFDQLGDEIDGDDHSQEALGLTGAFYYYLSSLYYYNEYTKYGDLNCKDKYKEILKKSINAGKSSSWFNKLSYVYNIEEDEITNKIVINEDRILMLGVKEQISHEIEEYVESRTSKNRDWDDVYLEDLNFLKNGTHNQMLRSLVVFFELLGYKVRRGNNQLGEPDLIVISMQTNPKYQLGIEVKSSETGGEEGVGTLGEILVDIAQIQKDRPDYITIPTIITQKTTFSDKTVNAAYNRTNLITVDVFSTLLRKNFDKIKRFNELKSQDRTTYRESLYSPIELYTIFMPQGDGVLKDSDFDTL